MRQLGVYVIITEPCLSYRQIAQTCVDCGVEMLQLREKQKVKKAYGLLEKQFRAYYTEAARLKGITGENMLFLLEK